MNYDNNFLKKVAKDNGFNAGMLEKVLRLVDVLTFFNETPILRDNLALKGGTALNLIVFDLPRLSVDIDLDFCQNVGKAEMLASRELINDVIMRYMTSQGYILGNNSKNHHALDSFEFFYQNAAGNRDNIKIELNYMLRTHVFDCVNSTLRVDCLGLSVPVMSLSLVDLLGSKTAALINRGKPRDLYDFKNILQAGLINSENIDIYRKTVAFYLALSSQHLSLPISYENIEKISLQDIKKSLYPVIKARDHFNFTQTREYVLSSLSDLLRFTPDELQFLKDFANNRYAPSLLFDDPAIINRIQTHPMILWKLRDKEFNDRKPTLDSVIEKASKRVATNNTPQNTLAKKDVHK